MKNKFTLFIEVLFVTIIILTNCGSNNNNNNNSGWEYNGNSESQQPKENLNSLENDFFIAVQQLKSCKGAPEIISKKRNSIG